MPSLTYGLHDPESLRKTAAQLERLAADLRSAADEMAIGNLPTIRMAYQDSLMDGMTFIRKFTGNAKVTIQKAMAENRTFESSSASPDSAATPASSKSQAAKKKRRS